MGRTEAQGLISTEQIGRSSIIIFCNMNSAIYFNYISKDVQLEDEKYVGG